MDLDLPTPGKTPGPEWARGVNKALEDLNAGKLGPDGVGDALVSELEDPESAASVALSATFVRGVSGTRVILFGTSLENQNAAGAGVLDPPGPSYAVHGRGWFNWYNAFAGQRCELVRNAGVGGNTSAQMLARIDADVLAYESDWVFMGAPVNDPATGISSAVTIPNMEAILDKLGARRVALLTCGPSENYYVNANNARYMSDVNEWIRAQPSHRPNVVVIDAFKTLADHTTGSPATGMAVDAVHYSDAGATLLGREAARVLEPLIPEVPARAMSRADPRNLLDADLTESTGWSNLGSTGTVTPTYEDDGWGGKVTLVIEDVTVRGERGIQYLEPITNGRFEVGDVVQGSARFKWSDITPLPGVITAPAPYIRIYPRKEDNSFGPEIKSFTTPSGELIVGAPGFPADGECVAMTYRATIPADTDRLYLGIGWQGAQSGTVEVSDLTFWREL